MKQKLYKLVALVFLTILIVVISPFAYSQEQPSDVQDSEKVEQTTNKKTEAKTQPPKKKFSVKLDHVPLFEIQNEFESMSSKERAKTITKNILNLAKDTSISLDTLKIVNDEDNKITYIQSGETILFRITEDDAKSAYKTREQLGNQYLQIIKVAVIEYREEISNFKPSLSILYTILATFSLIIILVFLNAIFSEIYGKIDAWKDKKGRITQVRNIRLLIFNQITRIFIAFIKTLRFFLTIGIVIGYFILVFSLFPRTKRLGIAFWNYFLESLKSSAEIAWESFIDYLPKLLTILLIIAFSHYLIRFIKPIFNELEKQTISLPGFYPEWAQPTYRLLELSILCMTTKIIFPYLPGFGSPAFQGVSIFLGVLLSFGSTAAVSNAVSGIILIYTRAFQVGDRVQVNDVMGDVEEKLLLVTRLRNSENLIITIPNSNLLSSNIINYTAVIRDHKIPVILTTEVTLGYDIPWQKINEAFINAALITPDVVADPPPFVLQKSLGDFSVTYQLNIYTNYPNRMRSIRSGLHQNIQNKCNEAGIEILSPTYAAMRDGNTTTIPANYLPTDYVPGGFQLNPLGNLFQIDLKLGNHKPSKKSPTGNRE